MFVGVPVAVHKEAETRPYQQPRRSSYKDKQEPASTSPAQSLSNSTPPAKMHFTKLILPTLALITTALANPITRTSCASTCGNVCYYQSDIDQAVSTGYGDYQSGNAPGGYPHTYNNYEGFDFPVSGPYQEFPILSSYKPYTGGSPGADRVVFNNNGDFAGTITHTGASGNNFVACD